MWLVLSRDGAGRRTVRVVVAIRLVLSRDGAGRRTVRVVVAVRLVLSRDGAGLVGSLADVIRGMTAADADRVFSFACDLSRSGPLDRERFEIQLASALADDRSVLLVADDGTGPWVT
jgi:hypothetical protein